MIWKRDNSSPSGRICSTEVRPIQERRRIPIASFKEVAMRWKCSGNVSAEMCFDLGSRSCRGGSNESMVLYATGRHCTKKQVKKISPKLRFSYDFRRNIWHDFVTPFSTFASIKGSLPTKSTKLDQLRCRTKTDGEEFPGFGQIIFRTSTKKSVFSCPASSDDLHPKRSP